MVQIVHNGKHIWLGRFDSEIEAAKAYDEAARKYHGEFATQLPITTDSHGLDGFLSATEGTGYTEFFLDTDLHCICSAWRTSAKGFSIRASAIPFRLVREGFWPSLTSRANNTDYIHL